MRIQFFQRNLTFWMYVLHVLHGHFSLFHFPISFLKMSKDVAFLVFSGTRFHIWGPLYLTVSVPYFTVLLFVEYRQWKFLRLYLLFLIMKHHSLEVMIHLQKFVYFFSKTFQIILMYSFLLSYFKNVLESTNMVVMN